MTNMDDREKALEGKYAYDQELEFRIEARACKLFGLWIAEQMKLPADEAQAFAASIVASNLEEVGLDDVKRAVRGHLSAKNVQISDHILDAKLSHFLDEARQQIVSQ